MEARIKTIYDKYRNGGSISNEELEFGIKHFQILANSLDSLGERFHLAWKDIYEVLNGLLDYQIARKRK